MRRRPWPPERAGRRDRPAQREPADRQLQRLLRRLPAARERGAVAGRADLARLLPQRGRRRELPELARARATRTTPRRTPRRPTSGPPARATRSSPGTATAGCSWAPRSSDDPAGTKKTFGDVFVAVYDNPGGPGGATINDGKRFVRSEIVNRGSSAPNLLGVFNDKTAIEADRTGGSCDGTVYFAWSRFTGNGTNNIYIARSTDHGATWSNPKSLSQVAQDVQFPDISVTANGHVYVTFRQSERKNGQTDAIDIVKSTDCGATFGAAKVLQPFLRYDATRRLGSRGHTARQPGRRSLRGGRDRGRRRARLRRFRRPLRVRLHVLPARHAGPLDRRSGRRRARVGLHRLRPQQTGQPGPDRDDVRLDRHGHRQPVGHLFPAL